MQGRVGADSHVGATEVIVDGAHHADDVELRVGAGRLLVDDTWKESGGLEQSEQEYSGL